MIVYRTIEKDVILSERSESKDLRTNLHINDIKMRRFFDFAVCTASLTRPAGLCKRATARRAALSESQNDITGGALQTQTIIYLPLRNIPFGVGIGLRKTIRGGAAYVGEIYGASLQGGHLRQ